MKIGFKNFRRFKDFPMIELGGCTFLVGPNNSGKSTLLKAIVHVENNRVRRSVSGNVVSYESILTEYDGGALSTPKITARNQYNTLKRVVPEVVDTLLHMGCRLNNVLTFASNF